jgi:hypothetical protein
MTAEGQQRKKDSGRKKLREGEQIVIGRKGKNFLLACL